MTKIYAHGMGILVKRWVVLCLEGDATGIKGECCHI